MMTQPSSRAPRRFPKRCKRPWVRRSANPASGVSLVGVAVLTAVGRVLAKISWRRSAQVPGALVADACRLKQRLAAGSRRQKPIPQLLMHPVRRFAAVHVESPGRLDVSGVQFRCPTARVQCRQICAGDLGPLGAGTLLAREQHLRQQRPQRNCRRKHRAVLPMGFLLSEGDPLFIELSLHVLCSGYVGEQQPVHRQSDSPQTLRGSWPKPAGSAK